MGDTRDEIQTGYDWSGVEHLRESRRCGWCAEERPCVYVIMLDAYFCSPDHRDELRNQMQKATEKTNL